MRLIPILILAGFSGIGFPVPAVRAESAAARRAAAAQDQAVKDAVGGLAKGPIHDLADSIAKLDARILATQDRIDADFRALGAGETSAARDRSDLDGKLGFLIDRDDALARRFDALATGLQGSATRSETGRSELARMLAGQSVRLDTVDQDLKSGQQGLERTLAAGIRTLGQAETDADSRNQQAALRAGWGGWIAAAMLAIAAAIFLLGRRAGRERQQELQRAVDRLAVDLRRGFSAISERTAAPVFSDLEARLRGAAERLEVLLTTSLDMASDAHRAPPLSYSSEKPTVSVAQIPEPSIASRLLWPSEFLDPDSPLSRWRFLLESHFDDPERHALPVLAAVLGLRALLDRGPASAGEIGAAAYRVSESLHTYLQTVPELSAEDRQQASAAWLRCLRTLIARAAPRLDLREILPGMRVDPDLMHAVKEGPGNHLNVAEAFSWAILDRSNDRPKVLFRAQIAST